MNPTEVIKLRECSTVKSADKELWMDNSFRVDAPNRVFYFVCDSLRDKQAWIDNIGRHMVCVRTTSLAISI